MKEHLDRWRPHFGHEPWLLAIAVVVMSSILLAVVVVCWPRDPRDPR